MVIVWMILCLFFIWVIYLLTKDFTCPAFVSGVIWFGVYVILFFTQDAETLSDWNYGCFFMAFLWFSVGFLFRRPTYVERKKISYNIGWNPQFNKLLFLLEYILTVFWIIVSWKYISVGTRSVWQAARYAAEEIEYLSTGFMGIMRNMIPIVFFVSLCMYLCNPIRRNRINTLISIPPVLITMLFSSRGEWFYIIITSVFLIIFIKKPKNITIANIGIIGIIMIVLIFVVSSFDKYSNAFLDMNENEKLRFFFNGYFAAPPVSCVNWLNSGYEWQYGQYTFRFICAVFSKIFPDIKVVNTVLPFVITNGVATNVYTAIRWYANDFGLWWAFVMEFVLGLFYGKMYKYVRNTKTPDIFIIILLAMFMFPIINQFFDEIIFSRLSIWIQRVFWLYLFTHTKLFVKEWKNEDVVLRKRLKVTFGGNKLL